MSRGGVPLPGMVGARASPAAAAAAPNNHDPAPPAHWRGGTGLVPPEIERLRGTPLFRFADLARLGVPLESLAFKMRADGLTDDDIESFVRVMRPHSASLDDRADEPQPRRSGAVAAMAAAVNLAHVRQQQQQQSPAPRPAPPTPPPLPATPLRDIPLPALVERFVRHGNGRGDLSRAAFAEALAGVASTPETRSLFALFDADNNGVVSHRELAAGLSSLCGGGKKEKVAVAFGLYDADGSGSLDRAEMTEYLCAVYTAHLANDSADRARAGGLSARAIAVASAEAAFERHDVRGTGRLSLEEFEAWYEETNADGDDDRSPAAEEAPSWPPPSLLPGPAAPSRSAAVVRQPAASWPPPSLLPTAGATVTGGESGAAAAPGIDPRNNEIAVARPEAPPKRSARTSMYPFRSATAAPAARRAASPEKAGGTPPSMFRSSESNVSPSRAPLLDRSPYSPSRLPLDHHPYSPSRSPLAHPYSPSRPLAAEDDAVPPQQEAAPAAPPRRLGRSSPRSHKVATLVEATPRADDSAGAEPTLAGDARLMVTVHGAHFGISALRVLGKLDSVRCDVSYGGSLASSVLLVDAAESWDATFIFRAVSAVGCVTITLRDPEGGSAAPAFGYTVVSLPARLPMEIPVAASTWCVFGATPPDENAGQLHHDTVVAGGTFAAKVSVVAVRLARLATLLNAVPDGEDLRALSAAEAAASPKLEEAFVQLHASCRRVAADADGGGSGSSHAGGPPGEESLALAHRELEKCKQRAIDSADRQFFAASDAGEHGGRRAPAAARRAAFLESVATGVCEMAVTELIPEARRLRLASRKADAQLGAMGAQSAQLQALAWHVERAESRHADAVGELQQSEGKRASDQSMRVAYEERMKSLERRSQGHHEQAAAAESRASRLRAQVEAWETQAKDHAAAATRSRERVAQLEAQLDDSKMSGNANETRAAELDAALREVKTVQAQLTSTREKAERRAARAEAECRDTTEANSRLREQMDQLLAGGWGVGDKVAGAATSADMVEGRAAAMERQDNLERARAALDKELREARQLLQAERNRSKDLEVALASAAHQAGEDQDRLQERAATLMARHVDTDSEDRIASLETSLAALTIECEAANTRRTAAEMKAADLARANLEIEGASAAAEGAAAVTRDALRAAAVDQSTSGMEKEMAIGELTRTRDALRARLADSDAHARATAETVASLRRQLADSRTKKAVPAVSAVPASPVEETYVLPRLGGSRPAARPHHASPHARLAVASLSEDRDDAAARECHALLKGTVCVFKTETERAQLQRAMTKCTKSASAVESMVAKSLQVVKRVVGKCGGTTLPSGAPWTLGAAGEAAAVRSYDRELLHCLRSLCVAWDFLSEAQYAVASANLDWALNMGMFLSLGAKCIEKVYDGSHLGVAMALAVAEVDAGAVGDIGGAVEDDADGQVVGGGGVCVVTVVGASGLPGTKRFGLADPYAVIEIGGEPVERSSVASQTLNPSWDETFHVPAHLAGALGMSVSIWDAGTEEATLMGRAVLPAGAIENEVPLGPLPLSLGGVVELTVVRLAGEDEDGWEELERPDMAPREAERVASEAGKRRR